MNNQSKLHEVYFSSKNVINKLLFVFVILFFVTNTFAQSENSKKTIQFDDIMNRKLYPRALTNLQWIDDNSFSYIVDYKKIVKQYVKTNKADTLISLENFNSALKAINIGDAKYLINIKWKDANTFVTTIDTVIVEYNLAKNSAKVLTSWTKEGENVDANVNNNCVAYTIANNLYISLNGKQKQVTNDPDTGFVSGQSVHRNEFGIEKGTFWSPQGNLLAFFRCDESMVTKYPLVDINTRIAEANFVRYPMAGMTSHHVTLGIYNVETNKTNFIKTGEPAEQFLTNISWSLDGKKIYIAVLNREQNHMKLNRYDVESGNFEKTLFEEKSDKYVEPQKPLVFLKSNPNTFLWQSRRDGYNHLYLYDIEGNLLKQLTKGDWEVVSFDGFDKDETKVFYTSTQPNPLDRHFYSINLKNDKQESYTSYLSGTHEVKYSPNGKYFLDEVESLEISYEANLLNAKGEKLKSIKENQNIVSEYDLGSTTFVTLKSEDGSDLYARMITPPFFDENKKYPVLVYVYGGPHSQLVTNSWLGGANLYFYYLASQGYIVWTLDNRGTANRGAKFEQIIHRCLGDHENADQMVGVNYLKSLKYVDKDRIGVDGWSYGGFMALTLNARNPGVFKVTTAGGPVIDWKYYEIMYGERYMDMPQENEKGYEKSSLVNQVENLNGKILVIHGAQDATVVWQHSLQLLNKCVKDKKQIDYFVYPNHEHNVRGADRMHLYKKLSQYYFDFL